MMAPISITGPAPLSLAVQQRLITLVVTLTLNYPRYRSPHARPVLGYLDFCEFERGPRICYYIKY